MQNTSLRTDLFIYKYPLKGARVKGARGNVKSMLN